jgi:hypothetical protein
MKTPRTHSLCSRAAECEGIDTCDNIRKLVVSLFKAEEVWSTKELSNTLAEKGLGVYAVRKSLEFLVSEACPHIRVKKYVSSTGHVRFKKHGRVLFCKTALESAISKKIGSLLTNFQREVVERLAYYTKNSGYLSKYDLRKLLPYRGNEVEFNLGRLQNLGIIANINGTKTSYYCLPENLDWLKNHLYKADINDRTEYEIVKMIGGLVRNLYPIDSIRKLKGAIRPGKRDPSVLKTTCGMSFDIFYEFAEPILNRRFLAIDVYSRIPVTGFIVNTFLRKIAWASPQKITVEASDEERHPLKSRTEGVIVFRKATPDAINIANKKRLRFIRLTDIRIKYSNVLKAVELDCFGQSAPTENRLIGELAYMQWQKKGSSEKSVDRDQSQKSFKQQEVT